MPALPSPSPRLATVAAGVLLCLVVLGCMSISFGGKSICGGDPTEPFEQKGEVCLAAQGEIDVYYPLPYASPPNLTVDAPSHHVVVFEQKPDHFRVGGAGKMTWVARGVRAGPTVVVPVPPTLPPPAPLPGPPLTPAPPPPEPRP
ncbi:MAG TPA: hypothetical protein VFE78_39985 [Gemmataceae bacterium]|jgi:hypothetical protein|nr:hypothetical protein [Gemmataceae bacterium]